MPTSEYHRARVARLIAERRCLHCRAGLLDDEIYQDCSSCLERARKRKSTPEARERQAQQQKARYYANRETFIARTKGYRLAKKLRGECHDCPDAALPNSDFCAFHRNERAAYGRGYYARVRKKA